MMPEPSPPGEPSHDPTPLVESTIAVFVPDSVDFNKGYLGVAADQAQLFDATPDEFCTAVNSPDVTLGVIIADGPSAEVYDLVGRVSDLSSPILLYDVNETMTLPENIAHRVDAYLTQSTISEGIDPPLVSTLDSINRLESDVSQESDLRAAVDSMNVPVALIRDETVVYANSVFLEMVSFPERSLLGSCWRAIVPPEEYSTFTNCLDLAFGQHLCSQNIELCTRHGERVERHLSFTEVDDATVAVHSAAIGVGSSSDDTDATGELFFELYQRLMAAYTSSESLDEFCDRVITAFDDLDSLYGAAVFTTGDNTIEPTSTIGAINDLVGDLTSLSSTNGSLLWEVHVDRSTRVFGQLDGVGPGNDSAVEVGIPLQGEGVLFVLLDNTSTPEGVVLPILEAFSTLLGGTLRHFRLEAQVETLKTEIQTHQQQADHLRDLNERIVGVSDALVEADTHDAQKAEVARELCALDVFDEVAVVDVELDAPSVDCSPTAGTDVPLVQSVCSSADGETLIVDAVRDGDVVSVPSTIDATYDFADTIVDSGYKSMFVVPLRYREFSYGAVVAFSYHSNPLSDLMESTFVVLGELISYSLHLTSSHTARVSRGRLTLGFKPSSYDGGLADLAAATDSTVHVRNIVPGGKQCQLYIEFEGTDHIDTDALVEDSFMESLEPVRSADGGGGEGASSPRRVYRLTTYGSCAISRLGQLNAVFRHARVAANDCSFTIAVPDEMSEEQVVAQVRSFFDGRVMVDEDVEAPDLDDWRPAVHDALTDNEFKTLRTAYHSGYFDAGGTTGKDVAEYLDISQPTFSRVQRTAVRKLLATIWGGEQSRI